MERWKNIEDGTLNARTIYVGAYGWRDNDAIGHLWARTEAAFILAMRSAINNEATRAFDDEWQSDPEDRRTLRDLKDNLWYVGPFAQTVADTIEELEEKDRADEMRDDIRNNPTGYVY